MNKRKTDKKWKKVRGTWVSLKPVLPGVWEAKQGGHVVRGRVKDPRTGKQREIWKVLANASAAEALQWLELERQRIRSGLGRPKVSKTRFADYAVDLWERKVQAGELRSGAGRENWRVVLERLVISSLGPVFVESMVPGDVHRWREECAVMIQAGKYRPSTMNTDRAILAQILKRASYELGAPRLLMDGVKSFSTTDYPTYTFEEPNSLTPKELREFLDLMAAHFPQHHAMVVLGFVTGKRPSTLRPLRRRGVEPDVRWDEGLILFRRSHTYADEVMLGTKTKAEERVHVPEQLLKLLRWHVDTQLLTEAQRESDLLFPSLTGGFRARSVLDKPFASVARTMKLGKKITPRGMRRTFQDLCRAAGVSDFIARSISGHATPEMQRHYSTAGAQEQCDAMTNIISLVPFLEARAAAQGGEEGGEDAATSGERRR